MTQPETLTPEREQEIRDQFATWPPHATIPLLLAAIDDLRSENAKLIRWHGEDAKALDRMRATAVRLRTKLAVAQAASAAAAGSAGDGDHR